MVVLLHLFEQFDRLDECLFHEHVIALVDFCGFGHPPNHSKVTDSEIELDRLIIGLLCSNFLKALDCLIVVLYVLIADTEIVIGIQV